MDLGRRGQGMVGACVRGLPVQSQLQQVMLRIHVNGRVHTCQQEAEQELERKRAAKARLEELDRRAIENRAAQSLEPNKILEPPRNPWGNAESIGHAGASFAGLGGGGAPYPEARGRGMEVKAPRKIFDHKTGKFVEVVEPVAKSSGKGGDKAGSAAHAVKDWRSGGLQSGGMGAGEKEGEGTSRAQQKKLAQEERRRGRDKRGKGGGGEDEGEIAAPAKGNDKGKRALTREKGSAAC